MTLRFCLVGYDGDLANDIRNAHVSAELEYVAPKKIESATIPFGGTDGEFVRELDRSGSHDDLRLLFAVDVPEQKKRLANEYSNYEMSFGQWISKTALISSNANIGRIVLIYPLVYISENVDLADFVKLNVGSQLHHDVVVGEFSTIAPGCVVLGGVEVGEMGFVGAGSIILPNVVVGDGAIVGAGSVVTRDVAKGARVAGAPAVEI